MGPELVSGIKVVYAKSTESRGHLSVAVWFGLNPSLPRIDFRCTRPNAW